MPNLTAERLAELEKAEAVLNALQAAGVDNWDGYDFATEEIRKEEEREEFYDTVAEEIADAIDVHIEEPAGQGCGYGLRVGAYDGIIAVLKKYNLPMKGN